MLQCQQAALALGGCTLLHEATAQMRPGRVTAILGPNGAGKSTLLSLLSGERAPGAGQVLLDGLPPHGQPAAALALRRAVMPQAFGVAFDFTVREVAELGRFPHRRAPAPCEGTIVAQALQATGVAHLQARVFNTLSGGEKARVQLARALAQVWLPRPDGRARWLLLDEPTAALDLAHQHQAMGLLRRWARGQGADEGVGVVAVLHDLNLALRYADDALLLAPGAPSCFGPVAQVLAPARVEQVWRLPCQPVAGADGVRQYLFCADASPVQVGTGPRGR